MFSWSQNATDHVMMKIEQSLHEIKVSTWLAGIDILRDEVALKDIVWISEDDCNNTSTSMVNKR